MVGPDPNHTVAALVEGFDLVACAAAQLVISQLRRVKLIEGAPRYKHDPGMRPYPKVTVRRLHQRADGTLWRRVRDVKVDRDKLPTVEAGKA
jgi:hypothetical protein